MAEGAQCHCTFIAAISAIVTIWAQIFASLNYSMRRLRISNKNILVEWAERSGYGREWLIRGSNCLSFEALLFILASKWEPFTAVSVDIDHNNIRFYNHTGARGRQCRVRGAARTTHALRPRQCATTRTLLNVSRTKSLYYSLVLRIESTLFNNNIT